MQRETFAIAEGSDIRFRERIFKAGERFARENPGLNPTFGMSVVFTHTMDFMWELARYGDPQGGLTTEQAFQQIVAEFADMVIAGKHLADGSTTEVVAHA